MSHLLTIAERLVLFLENDEPVKIEATGALDNIIRYFRNPRTHSGLNFFDPIPNTTSFSRLWQATSIVFL